MFQRDIYPSAQGNLSLPSPEQFASDLRSDVIGEVDGFVVALLGVIFAVLLVKAVRR